MRLSQDELTICLEPQGLKELELPNLETIFL